MLTGLWRSDVIFRLSKLLYIDAHQTEERNNTSAADSVRLMYARGA